MKPYTFRVNKEKVVFGKTDDASQEPLETEDVTQLLSSENHDWFRAIDAITQAGLYQKWLHVGKDRLDFNQWLTEQRTAS